jgi:hypothetical protein
MVINLRPIWFTLFLSKGNMNQLIKPSSRIKFIGLAKTAKRCLKNIARVWIEWNDFQGSETKAFLANHFNQGAKMNWYQPVEIICTLLDSWKFHIRINCHLSNTYFSNNAGGWTENIIWTTTRLSIAENPFEYNAHFAFQDNCEPESNGITFSDLYSEKQFS